MRLPLRFVVVLLAALAVSSCSGEKAPATPLETFKTYTKAIKQKDTTTMKLLLSSESIKMHEQQAKEQGVTLDDIVKRETLFTEGQTTVQFRNERIEGERATLEVKSAAGMWQTVPFVFEDGQWKIDKRTLADQMIQDIEQTNDQQLKDIINQDRQP